MEAYPHVYHPENTQFGRGTNEGKDELLNPFKVQQPINTKARRDAKLSLYNAYKLERHALVTHHFRPSSSNPRVHDVFPNEIVWRFRDPTPRTFPEGDIREVGFSALNGLSPLQFIKPIGVAASSSAGDGMTDFGVTESGLVSMINNSKHDILAGDYVAAIFPSEASFCNASLLDDRIAEGTRRMPPRDPVLSRNPVGLPSEKLMAAIVPINRLTDSFDPDGSMFAASMNGMFVVPALNDSMPFKKRCILPTYLRQEFAKNPNVLFERIRRPDEAMARHCFPYDSDIMRLDIWHNFGLGKALNSARPGRAFQCLLGAPFVLPSHEWEKPDV